MKNPPVCGFFALKRPPGGSLKFITFFVLQSVCITDYVGVDWLLIAIENVNLSGVINLENIQRHKVSVVT
ncbi:MULTISPECIES: hypothetical protein [Pantoea]|uniref:hypothetical protein n=1 Tax=Pantoea TaxID=53335 RepID=UPI00257F4025|nr:hypothetical protein [Pantoea sp. UBA5960]